MDIPDAVLGRVILVITIVTFLVLILWINTYPFIDEDLPIYQYIPDPQWGLLACAVWGLLFIGGLMAYTLYHIFPYL